METTKVKIIAAPKMTGSQILRECVTQRIYPQWSGDIFIGYFHRINGRRCQTQLPQITGALRLEYEAEKYKL